MASSPYMQKVKDFGLFHSAGRDMKTAHLECGHTIHVGNNCFRNRVVCWRCKGETEAAARPDVSTPPNYRDGPI